ncbi:MAG: hypothetical protein HYS63_02820 [Methylocystis sp.]|nr:hypothetical protein [Methylocystis sp.]
MPDKASDSWRSVVARDSERQFAFALERIGERLRCRHDNIIHEPLPERMAALLDELRRRRDQRRNRS